jgi:thiamine-phosphate diphosphorylase/hydroxyethylthiazole kinase
MLGPNKIIGLSVSDTFQAEKAAALQPDYLGLGPVFATATKPDHNPPLGLNGLRDLLAYISNLSSWGKTVPTVAIGGINLTNVQSIICQSTNPAKHLSGIAVVSAIMASPQPSLVCHQFRKLSAAAAFVLTFASIWDRVPETKPMIHHITNNVVKTFSANLTLAAGGSPIMSENFEEFAELAAVNGALVLNMGTAGADARRLFATAVQENNRAGNPVIFDPVGAGASALRRETVKAVLEAGYIDVIKGNESEIRTVAGESVVQRGVDSSSTGNESMNDKIALVKALAARLGNIVVMTGKTDIVSTGTQTYLLSNGHEYQGLVTGTGCSLGSVIAVAVAANKERKLTAVLAAITAYNIAAEVAAEVASGPGTWAAAFVDAVWRVTKGAVEGVSERAQVQVITE